ncbi:hypothetical protein Anapl_09698 [Anas platyrhynchos]|uniref:Uncharacterized protein n=1 Tax=Anas platyrhynchos TaxID=8839 RepID=R0LEN3_ANAPL|nr:hypothetical protein Anapl_09698 [Anas platyrhynchos]
MPEYKGSGNKAYKTGEKKSDVVHFERNKPGKRDEENEQMQNEENKTKSTVTIFIWGLQFRYSELWPQKDFEKPYNFEYDSVVDENGNDTAETTVLGRAQNSSQLTIFLPERQFLLSYNVVVTCKGTETRNLVKGCHQPWQLRCDESFLMSLTSFPLFIADKNSPSCKLCQKATSTEIQPFPLVLENTKPCRGRRKGGKQEGNVQSTVITEREINRTLE